ncbi:MAG: hypothetical protein QOG84_2314 [Sphingomonadales bacterium]|jgi:hypothetical protein|nr:hypothetical protein [Sphingomonadales bacterium]
MRVVLAAVAMPLVLAGCGFGGGESYRYRMTVIVDTPEGQRSGSSVIEVRGRSGGFLSPSAYVSGIKGEAVAIDLPGGKTLFALLRNRAQGYDAASVYANYAYQPVLPAARDWRQTFQALRSQHTPAKLPEENYPIFVTFDDPKDATSVRVIDPTDLSSLGPGLSFGGVEIAITTDPLTTGIKHRLPDFGSGTAYSKWVEQLPYGDARRISPNDFSREERGA